MEVAEFGIGVGYNCYILSNYVKSIHGYEGSKFAFDNFNKAFPELPNNKKFKAYHCNLATNFSENINQQYDMIIFGYFAYVLSDEELKVTIKNAKKLLKKDAIIINVDFLSKENIVKQDSRVENLKIYKRSLSSWINLMEDFEIIDFRMLNEFNSKEYLSKDMSKIDLDLDINDDHCWIGASIFKKKIG